MSILFIATIIASVLSSNAALAHSHSSGVEVLVERPSVQLLPTLTVDSNPTIGSRSPTAQEHHVLVLCGGGPCGPEFSGHSETESTFSTKSESALQLARSVIAKDGVDQFHNSKQIPARLGNSKDARPRGSLSSGEAKYTLNAEMWCIIVATAVAFLVVNAAFVYVVYKVGKMTKMSTFSLKMQSMALRALLQEELGGLPSDAPM